MAARPKLTQQRRLQTLEAAVEVIATKGLADTRVADIAAQAGLSPALLLYYFGSKEELLTEALTFAEDRFYLQTFHDLADIEDPRNRLIRLIDLACPIRDDSGQLLGDWSLWLELWVRALRNADAARKREALDRRWRTTIADVVRDGQKKGVFYVTRDPDEFALRLAALMDGLAVQVVLQDPSLDPAKMRRLCIETATRQLDFEHDGKREPAMAGGARSSSRR